MGGGRRGSPHGAAVEEWTFSFWTADGSAGGIVLLRLLPPARRCWYWAALARAGEPAPPRGGLGGAVATGRARACGPTALWADHICEAPFEQWTVANETYAVALDDPADALGRAYGTAAPLAFDLEWYATGPPTPIARTATSSRARCTA